MSFLILSVVSIVGLVLSWLLAKKMASRVVLYEGVSVDDLEVIQKRGEYQRHIVLDEALRTTREKIEAEMARFEEQHQSLTWIQQDTERELNEKQSQLDIRANDLERAEKDLEKKQETIQSLKVSTQNIFAEIDQVNVQYRSALAKRTSHQIEDLIRQGRQEYLASEQLNISRWLLEHSERLKQESARQAKDLLHIVHARYAPNFIWPKTTFNVEVDKKIADRYFGPDSELIRKLMEGTDSTVELMQEPDFTPQLRVSSGAGIDKEVIRLSVEEMIKRNQFSLPKLTDIIEKNKRIIDKTILKMGQEAIQILGLKDMHPEILKLIGALNYRTSHRQNQYFHTIEVARLAGMLAEEVGVDRQLAIRSGLLHDIGKVLDYKIEGSHAVISGDYAAKYGEAVDVVDTVLSHHNDKVVETPHAYILKAADAMSGARPGARVDVEEGYQKRIDGIVEVVKSFDGVADLNIMHAGREVHVFVNNRRVKDKDTETLAINIAKKLETDVQFPGQIKVTVVRRTEVSEVA